MQHRSIKTHHKLYGRLKDARVRSLKLAEAPQPEQIVEQHVFVCSQLTQLAQDPALVSRDPRTATHGLHCVQSSSFVAFKSMSDFQLESLLTLYANVSSRARVIAFIATVTEDPC